MIAPVWLAIAAAAIVLPSVVARARTNRRIRKARTALAGASTWLDALIQEALEDDETPIYDALVCREIEKAEGWTA